MSPGSVQKRTVSICDPTAEETQVQEALAPRLSTLEGKTVGMLDNSKDLVDKLLDEVEVLLRKDFPTVQFRRFRKDSAGGPAPVDMAAQLKECDAVITGIGD